MGLLDGVTIPSIFSTAAAADTTTVTQGVTTPTSPATPKDDSSMNWLWILIVIPIGIAAAAMSKSK